MTGTATKTFSTGDAEAPRGVPRASSPRGQVLYSILTGAKGTYTFTYKQQLPARKGLRGLRVSKMGRPRDKAEERPELTGDSGCSPSESGCPGPWWLVACVHLTGSPGTWEFFLPLLQLFYKFRFVTKLRAPTNQNSLHYISASTVSQINKIPR